MNILLSSAGRRVGLMHCFRDGLSRAGASADVYAIDIVRTAPAFHVADKSWQVPQCLDPGFVPAVLDLATDKDVGLIVPTIDPELPVYARASKLFARHGVTVCISHPNTIAICADKVRTNSWLIENGFPTVRQSSPSDILNRPGGWKFPLVAKPKRGSASAGVAKVDSIEQLEAVISRADDLIVQEVAPGSEHTINVYVNRLGRCVCAVPHQRLEVRAGEVSKGLTVKHTEMMELAKAVAETLPGAWGPLNIQGFLAPDGRIRIIEINARFGGGYPLAHRAGAHFTRWLIEETLSGATPEWYDGWQGDLAMLRYDEAVFLPGRLVREEVHEAALSCI